MNAWQVQYDQRHPSDEYDSPNEYQWIESRDYESLRYNFGHLVDILYGKEPMNLKFLEYHLQEIGAVLKEKIYESDLVIGENK